MVAEYQAVKKKRSPRRDGEARAVEIPLPARRTRYTAWKPLLEFCLALALLVMTAPIWFVAALLVKLTSRGPIFYTQVRLGHAGRHFSILKLRTMVHNSELFSGPCWSQPRDPRVTPIGRFLRRSHIDELPQLLNVLRGDMSLIGPRPERPEFAPMLEQAIPHYRQRLAVRPGLSGLAQVQLPPDTDLESVRSKLAFDLYYVQHCTFGMEARIAFATIGLLLGLRAGALRRHFRLPDPEVVEQFFQELDEVPSSHSHLRPA